LLSDLSLKVSHIIRETPAAITLILHSEAGKLITYQPGQFLTLIFNFKGREIRRSFSLSSTPGIDADLAITIKRIPNGEISTYIYNHVKEGDTLMALPPAGRFILKSNKEFRRNIFMIAAGSGITPIFSILNDLLIHEPESRVTLIYSNRNENSTIFYRQLNELSEKYPDQFNCIYIFSDPDNKTYKFRAHLNMELLRELISNNLKFENDTTEFLVCGPFGFMRMAEMIIIAMGFGKEQLHKENFVILAEQEAINTPPEQDEGDKTVTITYHRETFDLIVPPGKTVLKAALDRGIYLPYSCQGGVCGTCSAICTSGAIKMTINDVLTQKELDKGWILTCVGYPVSEKVILNIEG
jgi:ring-1,2-phenylacetyl-CoA epoxidase subunit PaaE